MAALLLAYLPDLGQGFVKDDFAWILGSRVDGWRGLAQLFQRHNGFFRPLVSVSFALNEAVSGLEPFPYGLTNLLLVLATVALIFALGRALRMPAGAAALAGLLWALNPHGIGGAILWISGRTSLLLIVFAVLAALALVRGRVVLAALFLTLALFSKEEAVLLPGILLAWAGLDESGPRLRWRWRRALPWMLACIPPLVLYFALRSRTAAFLPFSAPAYYRLTFAPEVVGRNLLEYADRSGTFMAAVLLIVFAAVRRRPRLDPGQRALLVRGLAWLAGGFGITLFVPVRSSLYVCFPSVGAALSAAVLAAALWRQAGPRTRTALTIAAVALPLALVPLYRSRNRRMVRTAELSAAVLGQVRPLAAPLAGGHVLVVQDDPGD
ncbi:MAG TPA: hypothetical protein VFO85_21270, partial [Vicinamibacteria bacterium]|nr:hypothetical protein [Vicinamibacteria bacterium]